MLAHHTSLRPAPFLACRGIRLGLHVRPNAFGNALGNSIARGIAGPSQQEAKAPQTQGQGPWSDYGYENGADIADSIARQQTPTYSGGQAWAADVAARRADSKARQIDEFLAPAGVGGQPAAVQGAANFSTATWKQQQVNELLSQGRYSEAAELRSNELIMTDTGPRSLNGESIDGNQLAFKSPGVPEALRHLIPNTEVLPLVQRAASRVGPTALEMLEGVGRIAGVGLTLGLHMSDGPSTKWQAGGSSLSYTADDFTLRVTDSESGTRLAVPGIHNPSQYSDAQYLSYVSYKANGGLLGIHDYVSFDPPTMGSVAIGSNAKPDWLRNLDAGNAFNKERSVAYPYNEVYVNQPSGTGYFRLDSYNPQMGEIVSRKFTQFGEITEKTGIGYVNEMTVKYPAGTPIANVPTNVKTGLAGDVLVGRQILEVPVQNRPIPQAVLNAAYRADVLIRDIKGRIY